jgi:chitinase
MEWKWTKGEPYERSRRPIYTKTEEQQQSNNISFTDENYIQEIEKSAYSASLNHDENTWDILNQSIYNNGFRTSNKREDLDSKIADRHLVQQIGSNPFLSNTNYIDDMNIRDKFLKPINTTTEREKNQTDA